ncbi:hypothetical protein B0T19DRAFT_231568 [Cercophora scortea]|uniref:Uncharacterized protein n=1 Tax=Cercophora scortea TaxID=314031 RepID=A0AAE0IG14_9PEZI|nr:hypothetical protein B0T19DRAFT_231568 [Cercophora scortea]
MGFLGGGWGLIGIGITSMSGGMAWAVAWQHLRGTRLVTGGQLSIELLPVVPVLSSNPTWIQLSETCPGRAWTANCQQPSSLSSPPSPNPVASSCGAADGRELEQRGQGEVESCQAALMQIVTCCGLWIRWNGERGLIQRHSSIFWLLMNDRRCTDSVEDKY